MDYYSLSLAGLFRIILILLVVYVGVRILGRLFAPRSHDRYGSRPRPDRTDHRREGEVRIEYPKGERHRKEEDKSGGEYVDYEEVD